MTGDLILITPDIDDFARQVATERHARNRKMSNAQMLVDQSHSHLDNEYVGVLGEIAVRTALALPITFNDLCLEKADGGVDVVVDGFSVDVKYTHIPSGHLIFRKTTSFRADCAILVTETDSPSALRIAGCVSRKKFFDNFRWLDSKYSESPMLALEQKFLTPLIIFKKWLTERKLCKPLFSARPA